MIARLSASFAAGFAAAVLWLVFVGVPWLIPSYLDLAIKHRAAAAAAEAQQDRGDRIEDLRGEEADEARAVAEDERRACDARLAARERLWSARVAGLQSEEPGPHEALVCGDYRPLRDSLRDAGLADG